MLGSVREFGPKAATAGLSFSAGLGSTTHWTRPQKHGQKPGNSPVKKWIWVEGVLKNLIAQRRYPPKPKAPRSEASRKEPGTRIRRGGCAAEQAAISFVIEQLKPETKPASSSVPLRNWAPRRAGATPRFPTRSCVRRSTSWPRRRHRDPRRPIYRRHPHKRASRDPGPFPWQKKPCPRPTREYRGAYFVTKKGTPMLT